MDAAHAAPAVAELLLTRSGLLFVPGEGVATPAAVRGFELEMAEIGYVLSPRLSARLNGIGDGGLATLRDEARRALLAQVGGAQQHEVLFRRFPDDVPADTVALWWRKVLVHFVQADGQPCIFCGRTATTHVLNPCQHVVCEACFDGSSYSACPSCEHHVDRSSPFFTEPPTRERPDEPVRFKRLDLCDDLEAGARTLFLSLCARKQALSPADREALAAIVRAYGGHLRAWLPAEVPVRENVAVIFGTLAAAGDPLDALEQGRRYMTTATDALRFLAVLSGTDGSLQRETVRKTVQVADVKLGRFWGAIAKLLGVGEATASRPVTTTVAMKVCRFKMAKLGRPLRRAVLSFLEGLDPDRLTEDMLRHRAYWVWAGEFLHPHEYAERFPHVALAFQMVRGKDPDGRKAPRYRGFYSRMEQAIQAKDASRLVQVLEERPGELARRLDLGLRLAPDQAEEVLDAFTRLLTHFATPVLVTLQAHLPTRGAPAPRRIFWPKGKTGMGVSADDRRPPLPRALTERAVALIDAELLRRFGDLSRFSIAVIDDDLRSVIVPFNERTASPAAVSLPRGSRVPLPEGKALRLFLHWCQPEGGEETDLDLSVGFYGDDWSYKGVCSYYQLQMDGADGTPLARSAGDLRDAPWPDGASEMVDVLCERARDAEIRYAVMVVNAYAGLSFAQLERAFAGVMLREDLGGWQFDPRTVHLRFNLQGDHGIFMPLVVDFRDRVIHWLDVYAKGGLAFNNVASSNKAIQRVCPEQISYFASGARPTMFALGALHAAARAERVIVRGAEPRMFLRATDESAPEFFARITSGRADGPASLELDAPALALLFTGDLELPAGSAAYALFRERVTPTLAASDLMG